MIALNAALLCYFSMGLCTALALTCGTLLRRGWIRLDARRLISALAIFNGLLAAAMLVLGLRCAAATAQLASLQAALRIASQNHSLPADADNHHDILGELPGS